MARCRGLSFPFVRPSKSWPSLALLATCPRTDLAFTVSPSRLRIALQLTLVRPRSVSAHHDALIIITRFHLIRPSFDTPDACFLSPVPSPVALISPSPTMRLQDCRLWFLISVVFLLQAPNAYGLGPVRRQDDSPSRPTPSPSPSPSPSSSPSTTRQTRSAVDQASASRARNADDTPSTVEVTQSSTEVASSTPTSTGIPLHGM